MGLVLTDPPLADASPVRRAVPPVAAARRSSTGTPWWLWPHLLSLDAPVVALVWQREWARAAGVALPPSREIVLGLSVWLIYLLDRLADAGCRGCHEHVTARHLFSGRRRHLLFPFTLFIASLLTVLTLRWLTGLEFLAGLGLLALAVGYFWLIHGGPGGRWAAFLPKEAAVGGMFAAGSAFFVFCRSPHLPVTVWVGTVLFAALCFLNCALITKWERGARDLREPCSLLNAFPRLTARLDLAGVMLAVTALTVAGSTVAAPVAVSALLLAVLDRCAARISADTLRVSADLVLLTPWIGAAFLPAIT